MSAENNIISQIIRTTQLHPRVAILMSGKGSNADVVLANRNMYPNFEFNMVFADQPQSNAQKIAGKYGLGYHAIEFDKSVELRTAYFQRVSNLLRRQEIDFLIYAGFMRVASDFFVHEFPGVNMHPADLTIKGDDGKPKYRGMDALPMAISAGEGYVASTVYAVDIDVDCGFPIAVSKPYLTTQEDLLDIPALHERLKVEREHILYPQILSLLSQGRISVHDIPLSQVEVERLLQV